MNPQYFDLKNKIKVKFIPQHLKKLTNKEKRLYTLGMRREIIIMEQLFSQQRSHQQQKTMEQYL